MQRNRIKFLRKLFGLTQKELANRAGVSRVYLSKIEQDEEANISIDVLHRIATVMGLSAKDLLEG